MNLTTEEIYKRVESVVLPLLQTAGVDLVELHVGRHRSDVQLQITADLPAGGITIEQCAQLNRAIVEAIDREGFLGEDYTLEFSSPGLDRPLTTAKDFARNLDFEVRLLLNAPLEGKKEITGLLVEATAESVTVISKKKKEVVIPLSQIIKGMLVI